MGRRRRGRRRVSRRWCCGVGYGVSRCRRRGQLGRRRVSRRRGGGIGAGRCRGGGVGRRLCRRGRRRRSVSRRWCRGVGCGDARCRRRGQLGRRRVSRRWGKGIGVGWCRGVGVGVGVGVGRRRRGRRRRSVSRRRCRGVGCGGGRRRRLCRVEGRCRRGCDTSGRGIELVESVEPYRLRGRGSFETGVNRPEPGDPDRAARRALVEEPACVPGADGVPVGGPRFDARIPRGGSNRRRHPGTECRRSCHRDSGKQQHPAHSHGPTPARRCFAVDRNATANCLGTGRPRSCRSSRPGRREGRWSR